MLGGSELILIIIISVILYFVRGGNKPISKQEELDIGEEVINCLTENEALEKLDLEKINEILYEITKNNNLIFPQLDFYLQESDNSINAMAVPGGRIIFTKGFIRIIESEEISEDEIAAVICHEIGHIELRHSVKAIKSSEKFQSISNAIKLIRFGDVKTKVMTELGGLLYKNKFSRSKEFEADEFAVKVLTNTRYNNSGLISFLIKLEDEYGSSPDDLTEYFMTHPKSEKRIKSMEKLIKKINS